MRLTWLALCLLLGSCLLRGAAREEKLQEIVFETNDALRWGSLSTAARHVKPSYRNAFATQIRAWGREIVIADMEVGGVELDDERTLGKSRVSFAWYTPSNTSLQTSELTQTWTFERGHFRLTQQKVSHGPKTLLAQADAH